MTADGSRALLEVREVTKRFPGVVALRGVSLQLGAGEILAVVGENGAGKSTLMRILAGVQAPDEGVLMLDGEEVRIDSVQAALDRGIALIHQELNLATNLSVADNIFLGREPRRLGTIDERRLRREAQTYLDMLGLEVNPAARLGSLSICHQQLVEIAKALSTDARILIMDEPTSSLSQNESERLFGVIRDLKRRGVSVIYISHRLGEVRQIADRVMVMRDGENAGELKREEVTHDRMVQMMVGRDVSQFYQRVRHELGEEVLSVRDLRSAAHPRHTVSFTLRAGEIVGAAGLVGAGRTEMLETLFGVTPSIGGEVRIEGALVAIGSPRDAIRSGLALVPENRKEQGLIIDMAVRDNLSLVSLRRDRRKFGIRNARKERMVSREMVGKMRVKTPSDRQTVRYLSGGNQQKVVLGKWLAMTPKVLLLDEPTRGIDIGAKEEIYGLMEELARSGVAILFVSSEMEEVMGMADRVLVMHEGRLTGELGRDEVSEEAIMRLATGQEEPAVAI